MQLFSCHYTDISFASIVSDEEVAIPLTNFMKLSSTALPLALSLSRAAPDFFKFQLFLDVELLLLFTPVICRSGSFKPGLESTLEA